MYSYMEEMKHGPYSILQPDGILIETGEYLFGLKSGVCKYYENGLLYSETNFVCGKKNGIELIYNIVGNVIEERNYCHGKLHGVTKIYYPDGSNKGSVIYYNGNLCCEITSDNIKKTSNGETMYYRGKRNGSDIYYYKNGNIFSLNNYLDDGPHGPKFHYDKYGNITDMRYFVDCTEDIMTIYYECGKPKTVCS